MDALSSSEVYLFEGFRLDRRGGGLFWRDDGGVFVPVTIGSRGLDILGVLVSRAGEVVSKEEIIGAVWRNTVVEDSNLTVQISALRRVLDRGRTKGSCIQTVPGRGYRFVAAGAQPDAETPSAPSPVEDTPFDVVPPAIAAGMRRQRPRSDLPLRIGSARRLATILTPTIATIVGAVLVLGVSAWWAWSPTKPAPVATSIPAPLAAPRLSIVVLPFANFSDDPGQQYFADGITEDLTTDLSRMQHSFVISRNTAFTYRNKPIDTKQIGRELGVRYVLEGSVRRSGNKVRVNAQLVDAEKDVHLWAEQFDGDMGDMLVLQNDVTSRIAVALGIELIGREAARPNENPDALDYFFRASDTLSKPPTREIYAEVIDLLERALALDPSSPEAQGRLASVLAGRVMNNMSDSTTADLERAKALSERALASWPRSPIAHYAKGQALRAERRYAEAIPEYEAVLAYNPNAAYSFFNIGQCKLVTGSIDETIPLTERAIRLSPRDPFALGTWYLQIGFVHLLQSRTNEALIWLEKARSHSPAHSIIRASLASAYALDGETDRAAVELTEARRLSGDDRFSSLVRLRVLGSYGVMVPKIRALAESTYLAGLRKAGMPEE